MIEVFYNSRHIDDMNTFNHYDTSYPPPPKKVRIFIVIKNMNVDKSLSVMHSVYLIYGSHRKKLS